MMYRADEEMGHSVVGGLAIGAGGVIGPAHRVAVGLEASDSCRIGAGKGRFGSCSLGSIGGGMAMSTLLGN